LEPELLKRMEEVLSNFDQQTIRFDHVITRRSGQRRFVDLHMHMPGSWTLAQAAALRSEVEQALIRAIPGLHPTIQMLPVGVEAHFDDLSQSSEAGL
jgi:divalent metal cation (Fe/Co/Zn/Cd) transporter